jgi:hemoglobin
MSDEPADASASLYDRLGGMPLFERLVAAFYDGVRTDAPLIALYPEPDDLTGAKRRLATFLAHYWGGPDDYLRERGHPRLRMRHMPYLIDADMRDRWLRHMGAAVESCVDDPSIREEMLRYFVRAAEHLRNDTGLPITPSSYPRG